MSERDRDGENQAPRDEDGSGTADEEASEFRRALGDEETSEFQRALGDEETSEFQRALGDEETSEFQRALGDVEPIRRHGLRPEPLPRLTARRKPGSAGSGSLGPGSAEPVEFEILRFGEQVEGLAPGVPRRQLSALRRGDPAHQRQVDLHGLDADGAARALRRELRDAIRAGERCLLIVHGRGLHSEGEAVLKGSLPGWLAEPAHGPQVLAFASAQPRHGGPGASYVLLRAGGGPGRRKR